MCLKVTPKTYLRFTTLSADLAPVGFSERPGRPTNSTKFETVRPKIRNFLMHRYNWIRPHQFNGGLAPARAEEKLNVVSGIS